MYAILSCLPKRGGLGPFGPLLNQPLIVNLLLTRKKRELTPRPLKEEKIDVQARMHKLFRVKTTKLRNEW